MTTNTTTATSPGTTTKARSSSAACDLGGEVAFLSRALKAPTLRESVPRLAQRARAAGAIGSRASRSAGAAGGAAESAVAARGSARAGVAAVAALACPGLVLPGGATGRALPAAAAAASHHQPGVARSKRGAHGSKPQVRRTATTSIFLLGSSWPGSLVTSGLR